MKVRVPVVPVANDDEQSMVALADFFAGHPAIRGVELLPYHPLGLHKYDALGTHRHEFEKPDPARLETLAAGLAELIEPVRCESTRGLS